jgi:hypothetical protein
MRNRFLDERTARDIDTLIAKILRGLGNLSAQIKDDNDLHWLFLRVFDQSNRACDKRNVSRSATIAI